MCLKPPLCCFRTVYCKKRFVSVRVGPLMGVTATGRVTYAVVGEIGVAVITVVPADERESVVSVGIGVEG